MGAESRLQAQTADLGLRPWQNSGLLKGHALKESWSFKTLQLAQGRVKDTHCLSYAAGRTPPTGAALTGTGPSRGLGLKSDRGRLVQETPGRGRNVQRRPWLAVPGTPDDIPGPTRPQASPSGLPRENSPEGAWAKTGREPSDTRGTLSGRRPEFRGLQIPESETFRDTKAGIETRRKGQTPANLPGTFLKEPGKEPGNKGEDCWHNHLGWHMRNSGDVPGGSQHRDGDGGALGSRTAPHGQGAREGSGTGGSTLARPHRCPQVLPQCTGAKTLPEVTPWE